MTELKKKIKEFECFYENLKRSCPEDLNEMRTSWDELKDYCDSYFYFVEELKELIEEEEKQC